LKLINKDINLKLAKKSKVHKLSPNHIAERKTNCRRLYENHLAGDKWKFVVTIDEAWIHMSDTNKKRSIYYHKRGDKDRQIWFKECFESYPKGFMIVAGFCYKGKLKLKKVEPNTKINSNYYQTNVIAPIFRNEIPLL